MPTKIRVIFFAAFFLCSAVFAEEEPVYYSSESSEIEFTDAGEVKEIVLRGGVKIVFQDNTILCESARFDNLTGDISAEGTLSVENPDGVFQADNFVYNVREEKGILLNPSFSMPPLYGKAKSVEKKDGIFVLDRGYITTCDREHPHFRISAERMEYVQNDYIRAQRMRLTFGEKFTVFYFPSYTIDARTKEPPLIISPGYSTRVGETAEVIFSHRLGREKDTVLKERISLGGKGFGFGLETFSRGKGFSGNGFVYRRWDDERLEPGGLFEFGKSYGTGRGESRVILDWRWMHDDEFFNDFFRSEFIRKSKTYNYLSFTRCFPAGIFNFNVRHSAGENFLKVEKLPEMQFYTPLFRIGDSPVFIENDLRFTNFRSEGENYLRMMDVITVKGRKDAGYLAFSPYLSAGGINYRSDLHDDRFNLVRELGVKSTAVLKKDGGKYTSYLIPSVSLFYRGLDYKPGEIGIFDGIERLDDGKFAAFGAEWFLAGDAGYTGRVSLENVYSFDRGEFEESRLKYDLQITPLIFIEGENEWNFADREYRFGVNDLVFRSGRNGYSMGNRYDRESGTSGISGKFSRVVDENWRFAMGVQYDIHSGGFSRKTFEVWRKLHCWEVNFEVSSDDEDFSFFVTAYPILF